MFFYLLVVGIEGKVSAFGDESGGGQMEIPFREVNTSKYSVSFARLIIAEPIFFRLSWPY